MCLGLADGALAADMSVQASNPFFYMPPVNPNWDWSGVYLGFNGGYGFGNGGVAGNLGRLGDPVGFSTAGDPTGAVFGGQIGYNWQAASVVFGVEGDFDGATIENSGNAVTSSIILPGAPVGVQASSRVNWLASIRGRLGYTWGPGMIYITGGGAWDNTDIKTLACDTAFVTCASNNFSHTSNGWAGGAGFQWLLTPNWIARAEYLFYGLPNTPTNGAGFGVNITTGHANFNVIRVGLDYKFDWH